MANIGEPRRETYEPPESLPIPQPVRMPAPEPVKVPA
jgi:hypothetical protein